MSDFQLLPSAAAAIKNLELVARYIVEGFLVGLHKSPFHGFSVEFSEHRQYMPGDNIRDIDWKVFGRTDRYYIKQYEEETNLKAHILLDISGSMNYSSHEVSKLDYGRYLAAAFSFLLLQQRDAVGLALFSDKLDQYLPPKSAMSYVTFLMEALENAQAKQQRTGISQVLHSLAEQIKKPGLIILLTEFLYEEPERIIEGLRHFRYYNQEVIIFNIVDPRDIDFAFEDEATFVDMETGESLKTQPHLIREAYRESVQNFYAKLRQECLNMRVDFHTIVTTESFDKALVRYMLKRKRLF